MTQKDFYAIIQNAMKTAQEQGWPIDQILDDAKEAVAQWEEASCESLTQVALDHEGLNFRISAK